jgi:hypothetical protein
VDLNPDPVKPTLCPGKAVLGLSVICGTTVNTAVTTAPLGLLVRVTVHGDPSEVATELTTKFPVAKPELMEHVEVTKRAVPAKMVDVTLQELSVRVSPVPANAIVAPGEPLDGVSVR